MVDEQLLAYGIANMAGIAGYNGWRWIFIIEGLATIVAAAASKFLIVDWPETATFLNEEERELLLFRLNADYGEARMDRLDGPTWKRILSDIKIWLGCVPRKLRHLSKSLTILQPDDVFWHCEWWLRDLVFYADNSEATWLDCDTGSGDEYSNLCGCNSNLAMCCCCQ